MMNISSILLVIKSSLLPVLLLLMVSIISNTLLLDATSLSEKSITPGQTISLFGAIDFKVSPNFYLKHEFIYTHGIYSNVIYRADGTKVGTIENGYDIPITEPLFLNLLNTITSGRNYEPLQVKCNSDDLIKITNPKILSYCYGYGKDVLSENHETIIYNLLTAIQFTKGTIILNFAVPMYWNENNFREVESIINSMTPRE